MNKRAAEIDFINRKPKKVVKCGSYKIITQMVNLLACAITPALERNLYIGPKTG
jgi:hypothetical protein